MIFQILNLLTLYLSKNKVIMTSDLFLNYDKEIQSKIIELIYRFMKPNRANIRQKKILHSIDMIQSKKIVKTNLAGLWVNKENFYITFKA